MPDYLDAPEDVEDRKFYVYYLRRPDKPDLLVSSLGCPFYVGKGFNGRIYEHRREAKRLLHKPGRKTYKINIIHKLWKCGLDFTEEILSDNLTEQEAFEMECVAISIYGRIDLETGILTNVTDGGEGCSGFIHPEESKAKINKGNSGKVRSLEVRQQISNSLLGHIPWNKGIPWPEDFKPKLGAANKGKVASEQTREKLRKAHIGRPGWNKGISPSDVTKAKISKANKGKKRTKETCEKLRQANLGEKNPQYGKHPSDETREKLKVANKKNAKNRQKDSKGRFCKTIIRIPYLD